MIPAQEKDVLMVANKAKPRLESARLMVAKAAVESPKVARAEAWVGKVEAEGKVKEGANVQVLPALKRLAAVLVNSRCWLPFLCHFLFSSSHSHGFSLT